ncbi:Zinc finger CCCH domain-containing protein [Drosera capensis]
MVERKLFKTKLCVLYQRGRCARQSCSFAHGEAELRRFSGSFSVSAKLEGDPTDRKTCRIDLTGKGTLHNADTPLFEMPGDDVLFMFYIAGYSPPRSDVRRSDRKFGKRQHDGQSDFSGSLRASDGTYDRGKEEKLASSRSKHLLRDQIKEMKLDVDLLNDNRQQLEVELKERSQEVDSLSYKIQELESQLSEEKEIFKRSQVRLDKLVDDFSFDVTQLLRNEEVTNRNIVGDAENALNHLADKIAESKDHASPTKKKFYFNMNVEGSKSAKVSKRGHATGHQEMSLGSVQDIELNGDMETLAIKSKRRAIDKPFADEGKAKRRKDSLKGPSSSDKMKGIRFNLAVPPRSIAAYATDDFELFKSEDKSEPKEDASRADQNRTASDVVSFPLPPPPPPPINKDNYLQYKGDDEQVEVDGQEEDLVEVDIV